MENSNINYGKLIDLYVEGKSIEAIKNEFGFSSIIHTKDVIHMYIKESKLKNIRKNRNKNINPKELLDLKNKGLKMVDIANIYDISAAFVVKLINDYCCNNGIPIEPKSQLKELDMDSIIKDLKNGLNLLKLQAKYNASYTTIKRRLLDYMSEEEIYKYLHPKNSQMEERSQEYLTLFESGVLINDIIKYCDISYDFLRKIIINKYGTRPLIITKKNFYNISQSNTFSSIDEMQKEAIKINKVIPKYLISEYEGKELDINKVFDYLKTLIEKNKDDVEFKELMIRNKKIYDAIRESNYGTKMRITALLNGLPQSKYSSYAETVDLYNGDLDIVNALLYLSKDEEIEFSNSFIAYTIRETINKENNKDNNKKIAKNEESEER